MENVLFLQSEVSDPFAIYLDRLAAQPVAWDSLNRIWALYRHADCRRLLECTSAYIPELSSAGQASLGETARSVTRRLARLANPPMHAALRQAATGLFSQLQVAAIEPLMARLLGTAQEIDWVDSICRKLPALAFMKGLEFSETDIETVLPLTERLTQVMLPNKSPQQAADIDAAMAHVYPLVQRHVAHSAARRRQAADEPELEIMVSTLIGMLIQSVDAGRGLLSNAMLQALNRPYALARGDWPSLVIETLRFDPPIHNTRRTLTQELELSGVLLQAGQPVLLVLAAANRDPSVFAQASQFDPARPNNADHLTFGAGMHQCIAKHFSVELAARSLALLFQSRKVHLLSQQINYAPLINARLPCQIMLALD